MMQDDWLITLFWRLYYWIKSKWYKATELYASILLLKHDLMHKIHVTILQMENTEYSPFIYYNMTIITKQLQQK